MDKKTLIDGLNEDLAGELGAIIQYTTYAAKATGPSDPVDEGRSSNSVWLPSATRASDSSRYGASIRCPLTNSS